MKKATPTPQHATESPREQFAARRDQPAPWLRREPSEDPAVEAIRARNRARERTPHRRLYKKRRHQERMATDAAYREVRRLKSRRKYERRKARRASTEEAS